MCFAPRGSKSEQTWYFCEQTVVISTGHIGIICWSLKWEQMHKQNLYCEIVFTLIFKYNKVKSGQLMGQSDCQKSESTCNDCIIQARMCYPILSLFEIANSNQSFVFKQTGSWQKYKRSIPDLQFLHSQNRIVN